MEVAVEHHNYDGPDDGWSAGKLVVLSILTLAVAFTIINFIAETGIGRM